MTKKILLGVFFVALIVIFAVMTKDVSPDYGATPESADAVFAFGRFFQPLADVDVHRLKDAGCNVTLEENGNFTAFCPKVESLRVHPLTRVRAVGIAVVHGEFNSP